MDKVFQINLGGIVFTIEEKAYETLKAYLDKLHKHFGNNTDTADIVSDIEYRMAELFSQKLKDGRSSLYSDDINDVLGIMGDVNQMDGAENTNEKRTEESQYIPHNVRTERLRRNPFDESLGGVCSGIGSYFDIDPTLIRILFVVAIVIYGSGLLFYFILWLIIPKAKGEDAEIMRQQKQVRTRKLFRDMDNKTIGGVCAGIGAYFGLDTIWIRLALVVSLFIFGSGFILYIILWIIIPKAQTAAEKLQMRGERVDIKNIEREVKKDNQSGSNSTNNFASKSTSLLASIFNVCIKLFVGFMAFIAFAIAIGITIGLIAISFGLGNAGFVKQIIMLASDDAIVLLSAKIGIACILLVPIVGFILLAIRILFKPKYKTRIVALTLTAFFMIGIGLLIFSSIRYKNSINSNYTKNEYIGLSKSDTLYISLAEATENNEGQELPDFRINDEHLVFNDNGLMLPFTDLKIKKSMHDSMGMTIKYSAKGANETEASTNADEIDYKPKIVGNNITLPYGVWIAKDKKYKFQDISIKLAIPVGTILILDERVYNILEDKYDFCNSEADNAVLQMTAKGLKAINCEEEKEWDESSDENEGVNISSDSTDKDIHIKINEDNKDGDGSVDIKIGSDDKNKMKVKKKTIYKNGKKIIIEETQIGPVKISTETEKDNNN
jgi:phage shock protein PspC (stress-responsive transcriptional regulator)